MKRPKIVRVEIMIPEDLLACCYQYCSVRPEAFSLLVEEALMALLNLGRCEAAGLLCSGDTPACGFFTPRNAEAEGGRTRETCRLGDEKLGVGEGERRIYPL